MAYTFIIAFNIPVAGVLSVFKDLATIPFEEKTTARLLRQRDVNARIPRSETALVNVAVCRDTCNGIHFHGECVEGTRISFGGKFFESRPGHVYIISGINPGRGVRPGVDTKSIRNKSG